MANRRSLSRRNLLKLGAVSTLPLAPIGARATLPPREEPNSPRNIIFMVSDGMSAGVPALAEAFSQLVRGRGTNWARLARDSRTVHGQFDMASLDSIVTDSAAASTAWATGSRVFNGSINYLPDGRPLKPIGTLAKEHGRAIGLITTTRLTHATPAGFAANAPKRDAEDEIAPQYLGIVDVLLGGGMRHFDPARRHDQLDVLGRFRGAGYHFLASRDELLGIPHEGKLLGMFDNDHLPYTIDRNREAAVAQRCPTLAEMTRAALEALSTSPAGFLAQIEGGRVDHAAHNNDAPAMLWDQLAFDDALGAVIEFCAMKSDTLVVVTSDHGCGNPGVNGLGARYQKSSEHFERLALASASWDVMEARLNEARTDADTPPAIDDVRRILHWGTGIEIEQEHLASIAAFLAGTPAPEINRLEANIYALVAQALGNHTGVGWTGITHTSDWVPILAIGPGREPFHGLLASTDAYVHMAALMGIEHRNPAMTADEARKLAAVTTTR